MILLQVSKATHDDIRERIAVHGPIYTRDFFRESREHGLILALGEVGLVVEGERTRNPEPRPRSGR